MSMKDSSSKDLVEELKDTFEKTLEDKFNMVGEEVFRLGQIRHFKYDGRKSETSIRMEIWSEQ